MSSQGSFMSTTSFFVSVHLNNAPKTKILQESPKLFLLHPFSRQNAPPLVWNSSQGFTLLLPSLKSMVISSPSAPTACPFWTVAFRLTERVCRP